MIVTQAEKPHRPPPLSLEGICHTRTWNVYSEEESSLIKLIQSVIHSSASIIEQIFSCSLKEGVELGIEHPEQPFFNRPVRLIRGNPETAVFGFEVTSPSGEVTEMVVKIGKIRKAELLSLQKNLPVPKLEEVVYLIKGNMNRFAVSVRDVEERESIPIAFVMRHGGQTLKHYLQKDLTLKMRVAIATELLRLLQQFEEEDVIHRDLKPDNILIQEKENLFLIQFIDLGCSRTLGVEEGGAILSAAGAELYKSPEEREGDAISRRGHLADVWSLGLVLFQIFEGRGNLNLEKISADSLFAYCNSQGIDDYKVELVEFSEKTPKFWRQAIKDCLEVNVEDRPGAGEIYEELMTSKRRRPAKHPRTEETTPNSRNLRPR